MYKSKFVICRAGASTLSEITTLITKGTTPTKKEIDSCKNCFMPYDFVTPITNNFIHLARLRLDDSEKSKFGSSVSTLWKGMDNAMSRRDIFELREFVNYAFQEVVSGRFLISSQKN